jgi:hypothetical protein
MSKLRNPILSRYGNKILDGKYYSTINIGGVDWTLHIKTVKKLHERVFFQYRKITGMDVGYIFAPYIPIMLEPIIIDINCWRNSTKEKKVMRIVTNIKRKRKR